MKTITAILFLICVPIICLAGETTKIYDNQYNLKGYVKDGKVYDTQWNHKYTIEGDKLYDRHYNKVGSVEGRGRKHDR